MRESIIITIKAVKYLPGGDSQEGLILSDGCCQDGYGREVPAAYQAGVHMEYKELKLLIPSGIFQTSARKNI